MISVFFLPDFLDAGHTDSHTRSIAKFWYRNEVFGALRAVSCPASAAVMESLPKAKLSLAYVTLVNLLISKQRSLRDSQVLDPILIRSETYIGLSNWHTNDTGCYLFVNLSS